MPTARILKPRGHYIIISPVRDEAAYIEGTLTSVIRQTLQPSQWVVVDDGSTDATPEILEQFAQKTPWLRVVRRRDRGFRAAGSGVMDAFYAGLAAAQPGAWDFLVKLDGDLRFEPDYFERCLAKFEENPRLGIGGGVIYSAVGDRIVRERHPRFHVRGATKIYRADCWKHIGDLPRAPGWDTLDEVKANMLGWQTYSFEDVPLLQRRPTGEAAGQWRNWVKNGLACYLIGYHPLFMVARSMRRGLHPPYVIATAGAAWGFLSAALTRTPRVAEPVLVRYMQRQQLARLTGRSSIWR